MAIYQQDPIASAKISALERDLSESEQKRFELEDTVFDLNSQIEKISGYGPEYVKHIAEQSRLRIVNAKRVAKKAEQEHKQRLAKFEAQIRRELDRYLNAKKTADLASGEAKQLEEARAKLSDDVFKIIQEALNDNNPIILQPNVGGIGVNIKKLFRWVKTKMQRKRPS